MISFDTHSISNLWPLPILEKIQVFVKKPICFSENPNFACIYDILLFQSHSTANLPYFPYFDDKKSKFRIFRVFGPENWQVNVKKKRFMLSGWFSFHVINIGGK